VGGLFLLLIILGIALGGGNGGSDSSSPGNQTTQAQAPPPPPPSTAPKKASNGDDAADLHNRAQQAVNRAEVCLVALQLAVRQSQNVNSMATSLEQDRSICHESSTTLATINAHGFTDQNTTLFASADAGKSATNAGLAYLDTQGPSKLADFRSHVNDAAGYFTQGLQDLNARLSELGVAHVKK
jgi:hypothetical protein